MGVQVRHELTPVGGLAYEASLLLREYAAYVGIDQRKHLVEKAELKKTTAAERRRLLELSDELDRRSQHIAEVADELRGLDPQAAPITSNALYELQGLASELVHEIGRLIPDPRPRPGIEVVSVVREKIYPVPMRIVAYLRVSTDRQADEGFGLEVQEQAIRAWARGQGRIVAVCKDRVSGSTDAIDRPGLAQALGLVQSRKADAIVVARIDRLARDLVLNEWVRAEIVRAGGELRSVSSHEDIYLRHDPDDPTGTLVRQILGAIAQYERSMIRLRMQAGKELKRRAGGYAGGKPPYGWRAVDGQLVVDLDEQREIRRMKAWRKRGISYREIAERLNDDLIPSRTGSVWMGNTVRRIVNRAG